MRKITFATEKFYHIFNRGVDKRVIYETAKDFTKFFNSINEFNSKLSKDQRELMKRRLENKKEGSLDPRSAEELRLVDVVCYCLLPNHYHFLLKQLVDDGISIFMHKIGTGFTNYFNLKNKRTGSLFQGPFKSVEVESDEQLLYLSAYINGNPEIHRIAAAGDWRWGSYREFCGAGEKPLCNSRIILEEFKDIGEYKKYLAAVIEESVKIKEARQYLLE